MKLVGWLLFGVVISVFLFMTAASLLGWHFDVVPTGSMEPAYSPGGMVVTRPAEIKDIELGDAILFREPVTGGFICHRVIDVMDGGEGLSLQTKGDANEYPDSAQVSSQNFIGKTIGYIPYVGSIAYISRLHETAIVFMGKELSIALMIIVVVGLIIISIEFKNICDWTLNRGLKERRERIKKRKEKIFRIRQRFA